MRKAFFVFGYVMFVVSMLAAFMLDSDNQELESQLAASNKRDAALNERIEKIVSLLPVEVAVDKSVANMGNWEFDILMNSIQQMVDAQAEDRAESDLVVAQANELVVKNSRLEANYAALVEACKDNPQARNLIRASSCDSDDFHRCLKVVHGVYMYNYDTDRCDTALNERETCLENGGMTKYPTIIPSGT